MNEDLICLSSDDEYKPTPKKTRIDSEKKEEANEIVFEQNGINKTENIICIESDEDNDSQDVFILKDHSAVIEPAKENGEDHCNETEIISCDSPLNLSNASSNSKDEEGSEGDSSDTEYFEQELLQSNSEENDEISHVYEESVLLADTADLPNEAKTFLSTCIKILNKKATAEPIFKKFPIIIKMFRSLSEEFARTEFLTKFIKKQTKIAKESVPCCIISFKEVYLHLKDSLNSQSVELPKKHWKHVRKLEKVMEQLLAKLKELEEAEVDFDDDSEDDSSYIKHDKYSRRLSQVYKKYCEIMKKNPYAGRITHERLDFVSSTYNEINLAISKKYKNNKKFPSYDELAAFIQTVVDEKKLPLRSAELKLETEQCFKSLGDLLQIRRKKELYEAHQQYMIDEDPAKKDENLDRKLRISYKEGKVRIDQICEQYVKKQELGVTEETIDISESEKSAESDCED